MTFQQRKSTVLAWTVQEPRCGESSLHVTRISLLWNGRALRFHWESQCSFCKSILSLGCTSGSHHPKSEHKYQFWSWHRYKSWPCNQYRTSWTINHQITYFKHISLFSPSPDANMPMTPLMNSSCICRLSLNASKSDTCASNCNILRLTIKLPCFCNSGASNCKNWVESIPYSSPILISMTYSIASFSICPFWDKSLCETSWAIINGQNVSRCWLNLSWIPAMRDLALSLR